MFFGSLNQGPDHVFDEESGRIALREHVCEYNPDADTDQDQPAQNFHTL